MGPESVDNLEYYTGIWNNDVGRFWFDEETKHVATLLITRINSSWRRKSAMDDSGGNLEILTSAVVNTVRHLTQAPGGQKDFLQKISPTDSTRIRNLLFNFILNMTSWQEKIENKLTALTALQEKANRNSIDVYREYAEADKDKHHHTSQPGSYTPYYVLLGKNPSNIEK